MSASSSSSAALSPAWWRFRSSGVTSIEEEGSAMVGLGRLGRRELNERLSTIEQDYPD
jgi:hypothetical protein